jgi:chorismate dehydratase
MVKAKVSVVQYLNTIPLIWGMLRGEQRGKYKLEFTTPAGCAEALRARRADVGIIPSIEYQRMNEVEVLPDLAIASKGPVKSVLLFSNRPIAQLQTIAMDNSSRTSVALVTILLRKFYRRDFTSVSAAPHPSEMLRMADAALVIGDPALAYRGRVPYVYDLATEWRKFTGLPFVFALWVGHAGDKLAGVRRDFEDSRNYGLSRINEIAEEYAPQYELTPDQVKVYLTQNIDYTLDAANLKGVRLFFQLARELEIIQLEKDLFFTPAGSSATPGRPLPCPN